MKITIFVSSRQTFPWKIGINSEVDIWKENAQDLLPSHVDTVIKNQ